MSGTGKGNPAAYRVPAASAVTEFTEKRSRFIAHVWRAESEEEARARIAETRASHRDARHNCWCYILRQGGVTRCSDDGEPQGTAGQPILEVFRREAVENVCCVVTRYFGGILLGAGGLTRAYARSARDALDAAGVCTVRRHLAVVTVCPYSLFERVRQEIAAAGGVPGEVEYAGEVRVRALLPEERAQAYIDRVTELAAGKTVPEITGEAFLAGS